MLIIKANAFPPPPPDIFSNDALFKNPAFVKASPVPLAVPSHPPPAPPPITKCNLSIAKEFVAESNRTAENKTEINDLYSFIVSLSLLIMIFKHNIKISVNNHL